MGPAGIGAPLPAVVLQVLVSGSTVHVYCNGRGVSVSVYTYACGIIAENFYTLLQLRL